MQRFHAFKTRLAVNVGKRANVQIAVKRRQRHGAPRIFDDPRLGVFFFDLAGEFDAGHRLAHRLALIGLERFLLHHRQCPHLAQMQVRIDEGLGHKIAAGIDLRRRPAIEMVADGDDAAVPDGDFCELLAAAKPGAADGDIERLIHASILVQGRGLTYIYNRQPLPAYRSRSYDAIKVSTCSCFRQSQRNGCVQCRKLT